jgi:hypothetical protein
LRQELLENVAAAVQVIELLRGKVALTNEPLKSLVFLLGVLLVSADLRESLDVVLGVFVLEPSCSLGNLLDPISV